MSNSGDTRFGDQPDWVLENLGWVRGLCLRVVGHADLADDVSQEVWVRLVKSPPPAGVAAPRWIAGVVKKVARELGRKERAGKRREAEVAAEVAAELGRESDARLSHQLEVERDVVEHIKSLDEPFRRAILLRYFEKLSIEDIAAAEGLSTSGVRSRLSRAVEQLRDRLRERPHTAAGAFLCAALPKKASAAAAATASAKGGGSAAAWWSAKGLFFAALLVMLAAGVLYAAWPAPAAAPGSALVPSPSAGDLSVGGATLEGLGPEGDETVATVEAPAERAAVLGEIFPEQDSKAKGLLEAPATPELTLLFVDARGTPLTELPIAAAKGAANQLFRPIWRGTTNSSKGELRVHPDELVAPMQASKRQPTLVGFFVDAPGHLGPVATIDLQEVTADPIVVTIEAPMGEIVVHAQDADGSPFQSEVEVQLNCTDSSTVTGQFSRSFDGGQPATLRGIPMGVTIMLVPLAVQGLRVPMQFIEPLEAGRTIAEVTLVYRAFGPSILATLLLPDGAILGDPVGAAVRMKMEGPAADGSAGGSVDGSVETLSGGRIFANFIGSYDPGQPCEFEIAVASGADRARVFGASVEAVVPEEGLPLDLGEVQLSTTMRAIHGQVIDSAGSPCAGATVQVGAEVERSHGRYLPLTLERHPVGEDGRFSVEVPQGSRRYALRASSREAGTKSAYVPVDETTTTVELRLRASSTITGRVVVPPGPRFESLYVAWCGAGEEMSARAARSLVGADGTFSLRDVPSGTVDLALLRSRDGDPISWRRDVEVPSDGSTVTLDDWQLAGDLVPLEFTVVYPDGVEPITIVRVDGDFDILKGDRYKGWAPSAGGRLTLSCKGCLTYRGSTAEVGAVVELDPAYVVSLELKLPAGWRAGLTDQLAAQLRLVENDELGLDTKRRLPGKFGDGFTRPVSLVAPVAPDGRVQLLVNDPGQLKVMLRLGSKSSSREIKRRQLPPSLQDIRITVLPDVPFQHFTLDLR